MREQGGDQPSLFSDDDRVRSEPTVRETLEGTLQERAFGNAEANQNHSAVDPIWTWNAPGFLTGHGYGVKPEFESQRAARADRRVAKPDAQDKLTLKEKIQNVKDYFSSLEDYEKRKGGRTHYRIILSFDVPATNEQIRDLTNNFLEQAVPKAIAFGAIHRDTDHPHVHLYLSSRQYDGRRIQLKNNEFKTIDEKWANIRRLAGDKIVMSSTGGKRGNQQWNDAAAEATEGRVDSTKPERDTQSEGRDWPSSDCQLRRSDAPAITASLSSTRPSATTGERAASEKENSRLLTKTEVAQEQLAHLIRTVLQRPDQSICPHRPRIGAALDRRCGAKRMAGKSPSSRLYDRGMEAIKEYTRLATCL